MIVSILMTTEPELENRTNSAMLVLPKQLPASVLADFRLPSSPSMGRSFARQEEGHCCPTSQIILYRSVVTHPRQGSGPSADRAGVVAPHKAPPLLFQTNFKFMIPWFPSRRGESRSRAGRERRRGNRPRRPASAVQHWSRGPAEVTLSGESIVA
jgi:hypothetical protein